MKRDGWHEAPRAGFDDAPRGSHSQDVRGSHPQNARIRTIYWKRLSLFVGLILAAVAAWLTWSSTKMNAVFELHPDRESAPEQRRPLIPDTH
ncbi:MAG TPA: hypothetical protein VNT79_11995 [Phycisphaerae bacterium]|nr:hypothetical protein [Phycisphaerae bacterium]